MKELLLDNLTKKVINNLPIKVVQFGEGNFLRAFVDLMIDQMNQKAHFNGGVVVVQPLPQGMIDTLKKQDGLYHVLLNGIEQGVVRSETHLVSSLRGFINPYEDYKAFLETARLDSVEFVVSNTTEAGIAVDPSDLLGQVQNSFSGKLTAWLYERYTHFNGAPDKGVIILPCELINRNGDELLKTILEFCKIWSLDSEFVTWLTTANTFTNTLVDRIVPGFPKDRINQVHEELGYRDQVVCEAELYQLWVIEGPEWLKEKLPYEAANLNIILTDNMEPYRTRKVKILNGSHTLLVPLALLSDISLVRDAVEDQVLGTYLEDVLLEEIIPTIEMPLDQLIEFKNSVIERFKNPSINHYFTSISLNSISKFKTRVLPSLLGFYDVKGVLPKRMVLSLALLITMYSQEKLPVQDDQNILTFFKTIWLNLRKAGSSYKDLVTEVLGQQSFWGQDLNQVTGLANLVAQYVQEIDEQGAKSVIRRVTL
jgi:tagaturonate reductase